MASTRRKRRTKHRGNAAGIVEARGRTGRKPTPAERKAQARRQRFDRYAKPPTWRGSFNRAGIVALLFLPVAILILKTNIAAAVLIAAFMAVFYTPVAYYTDHFVYRRRQAKLAGQGKQE